MIQAWFGRTGAGCPMPRCRISNFSLISDAGNTFDLLLRVCGISGYRLPARQLVSSSEYRNSYDDKSVLPIQWAHNSQFPSIGLGISRKHRLAVRYQNPLDSWNARLDTNAPPPSTPTLHPSTLNYDTLEGAEDIGQRVVEGNTAKRTSQQSFSRRLTRFLIPIPITRDEK